YSGNKPVTNISKTMVNQKNTKRGTIIYITDNQYLLLAYSFSCFRVGLKPPLLKALSFQGFFFYGYSNQSEYFNSTNSTPTYPWHWLILHGFLFPLHSR